MHAYRACWTRATRRSCPTRKATGRQARLQTCIDARNDHVINGLDEWRKSSDAHAAVLLESLASRVSLPRTDSYSAARLIFRPINMRGAKG